MEKHSDSLCLRGQNLQAQARLLLKFVRLRRRHRKLSMDTKIIENRHCKLHQLYAGKSTKVSKLCRKFNTFFPPGGSPSHHSLLSSLRIDLQVYNFKKEDTFSYNMQLTNFKDLPRSSQNLSRKMTLQHGKTIRQPLFTGSYLTSPSSTSLEICETPKKTSQAFHGHQDHRKPTL